MKEVGKLEKGRIKFIKKLRVKGENSETWEEKSGFASKEGRIDLTALRALAGVDDPATFAYRMIQSPLAVRIDTKMEEYED